MAPERLSGVTLSAVVLMKSDVYRSDLDDVCIYIYIYIYKFTA